MERELANEEVFSFEGDPAFSNIGSEKRLVLNPNGSTITVQNFISGVWVDVSEPYSEVQFFDINIKSNVEWRVSMADSGAAAKAFLY